MTSSEPAYPAGTNDRRIDAEGLAYVAAGIFAACGMNARDAALVADSLVRADLRGVHSHGTLRVADYAEKLTHGGVDPRGTPTIAKDHGSALVVAGGNAMGQVAATFAMAHAVARARQTGVAVAAVGGSNHCGAMDQYALAAIDAGMIGFATTNALPTMAPWGGIDKIVGINPLAIGLPAGDEPPIVIDTAFSASSHGKIRVYDQKDLTLPEGWATDAAGRPTTDAAAAIEGLLQPIGAYKGTGMAMAMGLLSTLLSGAAFGTELGDMTAGATPGRDGHFLMALNIAAFEDLSNFKKRLDGIICRFRESRRADGIDRIWLPGEREAETEARYAAEGIPLSAETLDGITTTAAGLGVDTRAMR